jgi:uncharacterized protein
MDDADTTNSDTTHATIRVVESLSNVNADEWDALAAHNPTIKHAFLQSMIDAGCVNADAGWMPQFLLLERDGALQGAVPLFMKGHSYGEYVFDWAWAEAYHRAGLDYYPKLLVASPFTPCNGARIMAGDDDDRQLLIAALQQIAQDSDVSSCHVLFATDGERQQLLDAGFMARKAVQFHWMNDEYRDFDDFLSRMNHDKRKRIKQERKSVAKAGITFQQKTGSEITAADWDFFARCYNNTYRAHHSTPYLNREFFGLLGERMPENILLVLAMRDGVPIAVSLNLYSTHTLYGRYWGTTEFVSGLHFETCYYQTLEFCIARGIRIFEGGAQGEHKLARGFSPVTCHSAHWIKDARFREAISDFLMRESGGIARYVNELDEHAPIKTPIKANSISAEPRID